MAIIQETSTPPQPATALEKSESLMQELALSLRESSPIPIYRRISEQVAAWIDDGQWEVGDQLPSERRLTELLQVTRRTVRTALSELIESKHVTAAHGRGNYVLDPPKRRQLRFLGLVRFGGSAAPYSNSQYDLVHHAEEESNALVYYKHAPDLDKLRSILFHPPSGYEGILIARPSQEWVEALQQLDQERKKGFPLPLVITNRDLTGTRLNFVSSDHRRQSYDATCHLIRSGHRQIGFVSGPDDKNYVRISHEGYLEALRDHDIPPDPDLKKSLDYSADFPADKKLVEEIAAFLTRQHPEALVGVGTEFSYAIERAIQKSAIVVPDDLSVVLLTEFEILNKLTMRWTAYLYPDEEMIIESLAALSNLARGKSGLVQKLLPYRLEAGTTVRDQRT